MRCRECGRELEEPTASAVEEAVLALVREGGLPPERIVEELVVRGHSASIVRRIVTSMLDRGTIDVGSDGTRARGTGS